MISDLRASVALEALLLGLCEHRCQGFLRKMNRLRKVGEHLPHPASVTFRQQAVEKPLPPNGSSWLRCLLMNPQRRFGNIDQIDFFRCTRQLGEPQGLLDDTVQRLDLLLRQLQWILACGGRWFPCSRSK
jgi:hypothetical protein